MDGLTLYRYLCCTVCFGVFLILLVLFIVWRIDARVKKKKKAELLKLEVEHSRLENEKLKVETDRMRTGSERKGE